nr:MAG TPA: hypothetical protein [Caudoviricetes sp.]
MAEEISVVNRRTTTEIDGLAELKTESNGEKSESMCARKVLL